MKRLYLPLIFGLTSFLSFGQQPTQYSLYMWNPFAFNPAYAGLDNSLVLQGVFRKQWVNLPQSPTSQIFNAHMPAYLLGGGAGFQVENETMGAWQQTTFSLAYDYQLTLGRVGVLSLGLSAALVQRRLDGSAIRTPDGQYDPDVLNPANPDHLDPLLLNGEMDGQTPEFGFGVYFLGERFQGGLAVRHLAESTVDMGPFGFGLDRTYYFNLSYQFDLGRNLSATPSALLKSDLTQTQIEFSTLLKYNDNIFFGASFRGYDSNSLDAVSFLGGIKLSEKITLAYAYDYTLSELSTATNGSHEIMVHYNLGKPIGKGRPPKIIYNPRNL